MELADWTSADAAGLPVLPGLLKTTTAMRWSFSRR
jgi:hypothetical protein